MSGLEKATLTRLKNERNGGEDGPPIPVQFNPASLKLTLSNQTEGGASRGRQARQYSGNASTELAFDLVFDTADEADGGSARDVREKTARVEQFVVPQGSGGQQQPPPRVKFHWGKLVIEGVITSLSIDFDLFAADGTPLRAKMGVSIKEQNARYELPKVDQGQAPAAGGSGRGRPGGAAGGPNDPRSNRLAEALAGESAADFAARVGLDPAAWRGVAAGLGGTLSLEAGLSIGFDASLSAGVGLGLSVGVEAGLGLSLGASLGLEAGVNLSAGVNASASAGFALSAAGGVGAAVETVRIARAQAAAERTLQSFGMAGVATSAQVAPAGGAAAVAGSSTAGGAAVGVRALPAAGAAAVAAAAARGAATNTATSAGAPGSPAGAAGAAAGPAAAATPLPRAYAPPRADPRAVSFGFGVPLRPRVSGAAELRAGVVALRPYEKSREVPLTHDPTVPPWMRTPAPAPQPAPAARHVGERREGLTGCGCGCGPRGGRP